ncbi:MAG TPA: nitroreductase family protein [Anaerolineae bacterium]|nr:nitroreductase family protein [Anaerolineae bacterium]
MSNPVIEAMMARKSIRKYKTDPVPDDVLAELVRAGQQAPFAYQLCSLLLSRNQKRNPFKAPLLFTICVDSHRHELVMAHRGWKMVENDLSLLLFGIQDAAYVAENMVVAAESLGMGSCFLGNAPYQAAKIIKAYHLPPRVFPVVQLAMGYPAENPPTRPRYPLEFTLFEDRYPDLTEEQIQHAMQVMDEGYLAQDYYRKARYRIPLEDGREDTFTFENYGWTEHISRKAGQWFPVLEETIELFAACGFHVAP